MFQEGLSQGSVQFVIVRIHRRLARRSLRGPRCSSSHRARYFWRYHESHFGFLFLRLFSFFANELSTVPCACPVYFSSVLCGRGIVQVRSLCTSPGRPRSCGHSFIMPWRRHRLQASDEVSISVVSLGQGELFCFGGAQTGGFV